MIRKLIRFGAVAALLAAMALPAGAATRRKTRKSDPDPDPAPAAVTPALDPSGKTPRTRAESVLVADALTGQVLYEKNADEQRPPASTQKLLTALVIVESGNLNQKLRVELSDTQVEPVKLGFRPGEVYTRRELLEVLLVHSVNDVARALARDNAGSVEAFAEKMNAKALELGMKRSHFVNPNGLPAPGQYSTARDMTRLAFAAYRSSTIRSIVSTKSLYFRFASGRMEEFHNTNLILRDYPYCTGMKTGYTEAAGHCLVSSASNNGHEVISVVLGERSRSWLWRDSCSLLAWGLSL
ncbi:MAG: D-alanyl-D-alanine carboxypeptidase family protein [Verrucomicrobiota bacterium]